ncbi:MULTISPECIES: hypothetical protein [unclassified Streptomyces]|uniref:hypothetical protein n=1 Tax=unclassified Streptomyces TaxID=2593676 RepID=UPI00336A8368
MTTGSLHLGSLIAGQPLAHKPKIMYPQEGWYLIRALLSNWLLLVMGLVFLTGAVFMAPRPA